MQSDRGMYGIPRKQKSEISEIYVWGVSTITNNTINFDNVAINLGSAITYLAGSGDRFLINEDGQYSISASLQFTAAGIFVVSKNQTDLTLTDSGIPKSQVIGYGYCPSNGVAGIYSGTVNLYAGDVIRVNDNNSIGANDYLDTFRMVKIS